MGTLQSLFKTICTILLCSLIELYFVLESKNRFRKKEIDGSQQVVKFGVIFISQNSNSPQTVLDWKRTCFRLGATSERRATR